MPRYVFYSLALLCVALDQWVKAWVRQALPVRDTIPLLPGVFHFTHEQNRGMAFSLLEGATGLLIAVAGLIVVAIIVTERRHKGEYLPRLQGWALSLVLGGAIGNLVDRVRQGYVTDLFDFRLINFPVFNVADSAITAGVVLLMLQILLTKDPEPKPKTTPEDDPKPRPETQEDKEETVAPRSV